MRKAALLYNPDSGGSRQRRQKELESVTAMLRDAGVEADLNLTASRAHAGELAQQAIASGCDTIFACGGDGTIHNIAQVLAMSQVALAILPMGTANALAYDLGISHNLTVAAQAALQAVPRRIALGRVQYIDFADQPGTSYFVLAAGMGVDAHLFYKLHSGAKQRMGMAAYYAKAWRLWATYSMRRFLIEYVESGSSKAVQSNVTEVMAIRIRNFGGVVQELAPGASLERNDLRLVAARTSSRLAYLAYVTRGMLHRNWTIPGIDVVYSEKVSCQYLDTKPDKDLSNTQPKIYIEADGELLGTLPVEISIVPDALTLLAPQR